MSTQRVCDGCSKAIDKKPKITSTEQDGTVLDFCSTSCFIGHINGKTAT